MSKGIEKANLDNIEVYLVKAENFYELDGTLETVKRLATAKLSIIEILSLTNAGYFLNDYIVQYADKTDNELLFFGDIMNDIIETIEGT